MQKRLKVPYPYNLVVLFYKMIILILVHNSLYSFSEREYLEILISLEVTDPSKQENGSKALNLWSIRRIEFLRF